MDKKQMILDLMENHPYGLSIEEVAQLLRMNRTTASKYLFALVSEGKIAVRDMGKAKLHYLKKHFGGVRVVR